PYCLLPGDDMDPRSEPANTGWPFPFTQQDWEQTPPAVQVYIGTLRDEVAQLHDRMEVLAARLTQNSTTSHRPPSSDVRDHRVESVALNALGPDSLCPFSAARISSARTLRASQDGAPLRRPPRPVGVCAS